MGLFEPQTTQVDPTPESIQGLQGDISSFLQGEFSDPGQTFQDFTSPLQQQATGGIQQFLGQQAPEVQTFNQAQGDLLGLMSGGGLGAGQQVVNAAQPVFERNLQSGLGSLANQASGRFNTAFGGQARDLTSQALQDFNLFQQQALQQGQQTGLQAGQLLGSLAGQAGQAPFNRLAQAGQLGLAQTQAQINPTLQLLQGGMGFGRPMPMDTMVNEGIGGRLGGAASGALGGAAAGSVIPGLGTGVGALIGGFGGLLE